VVLQLCDKQDLIQVSLLVAVSNQLEVLSVECFFQKVFEELELKSGI
jgi:hypothetical protein